MKSKKTKMGEVFTDLSIIYDYVEYIFHPSIEKNAIAQMLFAARMHRSVHTHIYMPSYK